MNPAATESDDDILHVHSRIDDLIPRSRKIWTIGHSTRTLDEFVGVLEHYGVRAIADVRRHPGSRRLPQFGQAALQESLERRGLVYLWIAELGGRRRPVKDSPNVAWRNTSFRGYADHLESHEFQQGLKTLLEFADTQATAMMCAELLWWRCHRALVSDVLKLHGMEVVHIQDEKHLTEHPYTSPAKVEAGHLRYVTADSL
jgi:uncharacterized protein (DUF488 family)